MSTAPESRWTPPRPPPGFGGSLPTRVAMLLLASFAVGLGACGDPALSLGETCAEDEQCATGLCYKARCLDPALDPDGDGLSNLVERDLRTDPDVADTDADGLADGVEVGDPAAPNDSDGTGAHDALESALADADRDCIKDQFDPDDATRETDLGVVAKAACKSRGVCGAAGATVTAECRLVDVGGAAVAEVVCRYEAEGYEEVETRCDGLDNDCNGLVDEKLTWVGPGQPPRTVGASCVGVGSCAEALGVVECGEDARPRCSVNAGGSAHAGAAAELACNHLDDDCNGVTDDGVEWTDPRTGDVVPAGHPCRGLGACGPGVVECHAGSGEGRCSTEPGGTADASGPEACNGVDDDCDGLTDEGFAWAPPGEAPVPVGGACGVGVCAGGLVVCVGGEPACSTAGAGTGGLETCNGLDDDCDGETDEPAGLVLGCPDVGVCVGAVWLSAACVEGALACDGDVTWHPEGEALCDGLDDDCDGETDEGFATGGGLMLGAACYGVGACLGGVGKVVCQEALPEAPPVCSASFGGVPEACNGVDDDCDGETDEGLGDPPKLPCQGAGVCAPEGGGSSEVVCLGGTWACAYEASLDWEPDESSCDGLDNDCDGFADEGTPHTFVGPALRLGEVQPPARVRWAMDGPAAGPRYLYGGWFPGPAPVLHGDLWRFDPASSTWTDLSDAATGPSPGPRAGHAVAWLPGAERLLVVGGFTEPTGSAEGSGLPDGPATPAALAFDPKTGAWTSVVQLGAAPLRRFATLTAIGPGRVALIGGLAEDSHGTVWVGDVSLGASSLGETLTIAWQPLDVPLEPRYGHAAAWSLSTGELVVAGGVQPGGSSPLATAVTLSGLAAPQPSEVAVTALAAPQATRVLPALAVDDGQAAAVLFGGRAASSAKATSPKVYADALVLPLSGDAGQAVADLSGPPPTWGADAWSTPGSGLRWTAGVGAGGAVRRAVWALDGEAGVWTWALASDWAGPAPRWGATLVADALGTTHWLLGGASAPGAGGGPLQDAWRLAAPDLAADPPGWQLLTKPAGGGAVLDLTKPALAMAVGSWDPVGQRILLLGGLGPSGQPLGELWTLDPQSGAFQKADVQGTPPPPAVGTVFGVAPGGSTAWLVGVGVGLALPPGADGDALPAVAPEVHGLTLATLTWAAAPLDPLAPPPADVAGLAGGPAAGGLRLVVLHQDSSLTGWSVDPPSGAWTRTWPAEGLVPAPTGFSGLLAHLYDAASDEALLVVRTAAGAVQAIRVDVGTGAFEVLDTPDGWQGAAGQALGRHLDLGALGFGSSGPGGVTRSDAVAFEHVCQ